MGCPGAYFSSPYEDKPLDLTILTAGLIRSRTLTRLVPLMIGIIISVRTTAISSFFSA